MKKIKNYINDLTLFDPVQVNGLLVYPIDFKSRKLERKLLLLDDCFDENLVEAYEVSLSGNVEKIGIKNNSNHDLLILDGEAIIGAKQNRIAQSTIILSPKSESIIPVNCVEKGRWSATNDINFDKSEFTISPKMRDKKAELLKNNESLDVQSEMWKEIDEFSDKYNLNSHTSDLGKYLNDIDINKFENFERLYDQNFQGCLVLGTDRPFLEIFHDEYAKNHFIKKSIKSWCIDSVNKKQELTDPMNYIEEYLDSEWFKDNSVGIEKCFKTIDNSNGRSFLLDENLIHSYYFYN